MGSKNTLNLNLHNWVPANFVEMEELNENFKKLDSRGGITVQVESVDTAVEKKVETVAFV